MRLIFDPCASVETRPVTEKLRPGEVPVDEDDTVEYDDDLDESEDIDEDDWLVDESDLDDETDDELSEGADEVQTRGASEFIFALILLSEMCHHKCVTLNMHAN